MGIIKDSNRRYFVGMRLDGQDVFYFDNEPDKFENPVLFIDDVVGYVYFRWVMLANRQFYKRVPIEEYHARRNL